MRHLVLALAVTGVGLAPGFARAQEGYSLESLLVSSGSDPITSGIAAIARFRDGSDRFAEVAAQSEQAWFAYGKYLGGGARSFVAAGAVGHFQTAPLLGLRFDAVFRLDESVRLEVLYWPGVLLEEPTDWKTENDGVENPEGVYHGQFSGIRLAVGPVQASYYMLNFLDEPWNELPGISYTWSFRDDMAASLSATWNNNSRDWLPWIGLVWAP